MVKPEFRAAKKCGFNGFSTAELKLPEVKTEAKDAKRTVGFFACCHSAMAENPAEEIKMESKTYIIVYKSCEHACVCAFS